MAEFIEADGEVHVTSPIQAEYTLCGDAFDLGSDEAGYGWVPTRRRTVTCQKCAAIIRGCRGLRIAEV